MNKNKQFVINLTASLVNFVVNMGIGFAITPFIVGRVGAEAYGFTGLANTMVGYATLFTIALNSVAGRFITVAYHQGDKRKADAYFSSALAANLVMTLVPTAIAVPLIINLEHVIRISPHLVTDVKWLFCFVYLSYVVATMSSVLSVATFIKNKLYLSSLANIAFSVVRITVMVVCFALFPTYVLFVGLSTCLAQLTLAILNYVFTIRLTPELRIRRKAISLHDTWTMLSSGIWNTVIKLQQILQNGLSLLIANLAISPLHMGYLSIAQVVPNALITLTNTISGLFSPEQTRLYAQGDHNALLDELKTGMRITGLFTNVIVVTLLINGSAFIALWQPSQDTHMIYMLMMLTLSGFFFTGIASTLQAVPLLVNRLRNYSLSWLACGIISLVATLVCVKFSNWGIYAVAAIPQFIDILANITVVPVYASICLRLSWLRFYPVYAQYLASTILAIVLSGFANTMLNIPQTNWISLLLACAVTALLTFASDLLLLLGKRERMVLLHKLMQWKKLQDSR
ncbi:lipopolysaccharide biosynthesis protein [Bifidobacterium dentium]|uniref:lipopolysaccharide biosynthesis protein n=1 Tax=Bifidobacterium dentium TaxID=1689 RepID=UPI0020037D57|nr:hypothetical protein [Bifidobacterium dentium]MCK6132440.1 hypothetical protein [Bifidobacterium dentium]